MTMIIRSIVWFDQMIEVADAFFKQQLKDPVLEMVK